MILLFVVLCSSISTWAYDFAVAGVYYDITHSTSPYTVAVTVATNNANSYAGNVTIPASVTYNSVNYSVTSIGTYAFALSGGLTSVSIPSSVTSIDSWGFLSCYSLTTISIPSSVNSIGDGAFWGCLGLSTIGIPASVQKIGTYVFVGCTNLTDINANAANTHFYSEAGVLYNKDKSTLLAYPAGKPEVSYTISSSVDTIGAYAFSYCNHLTSITIPTSVVYMTHATFTSCNGLTSVFIPASVTFLENNPFYDCAGMKAVTVDPANLYNESVDGVIFKKGLSTIIYYPPAKVGSSYVIPSTVTYVRSSVFLNCTNLKSVTIPASVRTIRSGMFTGCTSMTSINAYSPTPIDLVTANHPGENSDAVFKGVDTTTCVLHVPIGSKSLYASAFQWKGFSNIVEGFSTGLSSYTASNLKVNVDNGIIQVCGATFGETLVVYSLQGIAVYSQKVSSATIAFRLPMHGLYIIRVGTENVKVVY
ncbi:MAG: leucine-rich repeat domain-containing protein [Paludibacter sp.]